MTDLGWVVCLVAVNVAWLIACLWTWRKIPKTPCIFVPPKWEVEIQNLEIIVSPQRRKATFRGRP